MAINDHGNEPLRKAAEYVPGTSEKEAIIKTQLTDSSGDELGTSGNPVTVLTSPGSAGSLQLVSGVYGALSVSTSATQVKVGASNYTNRIVVTMQPTDGIVYMGFDSSVTSSTGTPIEPGSLMTVYATDAFNVYVIAASGTVNVRITEAADQ